MYELDKGTQDDSVSCNLIQSPIEMKTQVFLVSHHLALLYEAPIQFAEGSYLVHEFT